MRRLQEHDSLDTFFKATNYSSGALDASDGDADLKGPIDAGSAELKTAQQAEHAAGDVESRADAACDKKFLKVKKAVEALYVTEQAFMLIPEGKAHASIFTKTPAVMGKAKADKRDEEYRAVINDDTKPEKLPAPMKTVGKRAHDTWTDYQKRATALATAGKRRGKAREGVRAAKLKIITELSRLEGKLTDRHPDDLEEVESNFRKFPKKRAAGAKQDEVPAPATP